MIGCAGIFFLGGFGLINLLQVAYICIPVYAERYLRYYLKEDLISRLFLISVSNKKNTFGICCTRVKVRWCNSQKFCRGIQDPSTWQEVLYPVLSKREFIFRKQDHCCLLVLMEVPIMCYILTYKTPQNWVV